MINIKDFALNLVAEAVTVDETERITPSGRRIAVDGENLDQIFNRGRQLLDKLDKQLDVANENKDYLVRQMKDSGLSDEDIMNNPKYKSSVAEILKLDSASTELYDLLTIYANSNGKDLEAKAKIREFDPGKHTKYYNPLQNNYEDEVLQKVGGKLRDAGVEQDIRDYIDAGHSLNSLLPKRKMKNISDPVEFFSTTGIYPQTKDKGIDDKNSIFGDVDLSSNDLLKHILAKYGKERSESIEESDEMEEMARGVMAPQEFAKREYNSKHPEASFSTADGFMKHVIVDKSHPENLEYAKIMGRYIKNLGPEAYSDIAHDVGTEADLEKPDEEVAYFYADEMMNHRKNMKKAYRTTSGAINAYGNNVKGRKMTDYQLPVEPTEEAITEEDEFENPGEDIMQKINNIPVDEELIAAIESYDFGTDNDKIKEELEQYKSGLISALDLIKDVEAALLK